MKEQANAFLKVNPIPALPLLYHIVTPHAQQGADEASDNGPNQSLPQAPFELAIQLVVSQHMRP